jgi:uncharacterized protein YjbI with pentapeptide repeats
MRKAVLSVVVIIFVVLMGNASAFNPADLQKLKATKNCADCDLSGAVLIHWNLSEADLSGANLAGANLTDAFLAGANLMGANLSGAILIGSSLANANLLRAKLANANLAFTDLAGATWVDGSRCERPSSGWCKR